MEGAVRASADASGSPADSPGSVLSPEASLELPPNGVRPTNERFAAMERRSFERRVLNVLSLRSSGSRPPLDHLILYQIAEEFGVEMPRCLEDWPYDLAELCQLISEIEFLEHPTQRFSLNPSVSGMLPNVKELPLLTAELVRQRAGIIDHLERISWGGGVSELFSRDSEPFFEDSASHGVTEEPTFEINRFASLGLGEDPREDAIRRVLTETRFSNQFFFRLNSASLGVSPGRQASRARRGRKKVLREFRSFVEVYRGGQPYNYGATGC